MVVLLYLTAQNLCVYLVTLKGVLPGSGLGLLTDLAVI